MAIQGSFKGIKRILKGVSREFQGSVKDVLRNFQKKSVKGVSRIFQRSFVSQFCSGMDLIAATQAEEELASGGHWIFFSYAIKERGKYF